MAAILTELRPAAIVARREVRDQFRDWRIIFPILGLTLLFPFLMNFTAQQMLGFVEKYGANIIGDRLVPFLLMIVGFFPISVSLVIALESFVGERERGSIEPLLCAPLKDWQLYLGKLISSTIPPLAGSFLGMGVYLTGLLITRVALPETELIIQIFALTIMQALVMVSGAVVISSQATSVRAANLLASFIIIPMALLVQGESMVMFWGRDILSLWWIVAGLFVLFVLLVRVGLAHFQREELLGREMDTLNFRWGWGVFRTAFKGGENNLFGWYRKALPRSLAEMRWAILAMVLLAAISLWLGTRQTDLFVLPLNAASIKDNLKFVDDLLRSSGATPVLVVFGQNFRVILFSFLLGVFSMGILGVLPLFATMGVVGFLGQTLANNGIPAFNTIVGLFLPHGIIEIPALILASAAVLQLGVMMATPVSGKSVGEVFLESLGKWSRVIVGLVFPLLLLAAAIEIWLTPKIAVYLIP